MSKNITQTFAEVAERLPSQPVQYSKDETGEFQPVSFSQLYSEVEKMAAGLASMGIGRNDLVGLISENRKEWLVADLAVLSLGAADVPRGNDSMPEEIAFILGFTEVSTTFAENAAQVEKLISIQKDMPELKRIIVLDQDFQLKELKSKAADRKSLEILKYHEVIQAGEKFLQNDPDYVKKEVEKGSREDLATIIFTSGTTGEPKGVQLSHANYMAQVDLIDTKIRIGAGDIWLAVLPVWHSFERVMQYIAVLYGCSLAYSKPVGKIMLEDFQKVNPTWMASVPRIWEAVRLGVIKSVNAGSKVKKSLFFFFLGVGKLYRYFHNMVFSRLPSFKRRSRILDALIGFIPMIFFLPGYLLGNLLVFKKIKAKLGTRFVAGISGGGALPSGVDKFFSAVGILLLEGYGLTETAPVVSVRTQWHPVTGSIGTKLECCEIQVRDEAGNVLKPGKKGILYVKGLNVMKGYYKRDEFTRKAIDEEGWFNTGDLAMIAHRGEIRILGRAKDTIVLLGGENVEPLPMEDKMRESMYISQVVALGQDQKFLGALIVPDEENIRQWAKEQGLQVGDYGKFIKGPEVHDLIKSELAEAVSTKNGFKTWERIARFGIIPGPFEVGKELSGKQEIKRHVIYEMYNKEINRIFA
ncbi:AMP-dependent synthetase/ligase [Salinispira pacifica]|uniref:Long-chain-fatty-acid--CoA ligase n=1 Tax=Salinispira pacifica TaxID=1307761 RepID=V5WJ06_9SPIO|nr:long-chain fatty acid--CoA ligase [Salinispira pacifica]AHC15822.1 Long-chain-fatty-acid--CoA ligase [Salinispira pacifica]